MNHANMFKKLIYSLVTKLSVALINFSILLLSSRYLGVSSRGEISIFILNITIIQILNEVYTGYGIIHFIPRFNLQKLAAVGFAFTVIFCSLSNSLVVVLNKQLPEYEFLGYIISLLVILNTFNCVIILGKENLRAYNLLSFLQPLLLLLGLCVSVFFFKIFTIEAFLFPLLFSFLIAFVFSSFRVLSFMKNASTKLKFNLKPVLMNGLFFQAGTLLFLFCNRFSYYLLPDKASVGLYSSASSFMESLFIIVNGISPVLLSRMANQQEHTETFEMTLTLGKLSLILALTLVLVLIGIPASFFVYVLGSGFSGIKEIMLLYAPAVLMACFFMALTNYFVATGKQKRLVFCYSLGFLSSLFFAPTLIATFGVKGAAFNADISYALVAISVSLVFLFTGKLNAKRLFSFQQDILNLKKLLRPLAP